MNIKTINMLIARKFVFLLQVKHIVLIGRVFWAVILADLEDKAPGSGLFLFFKFPVQKKLLF